MCSSDLVGGTFTDVVAQDASGALTSCKVPTTTSRPAAGVLQGLAHLTGGGRVATSLAHGTTIVTNAIVEKRTAAVGLVTTRGFRDVLEIARQNWTHLYRLDAPAKRAAGAATLARRGHRARGRRRHRAGAARAR